ncbi:hypothetical protein BJ878DRAFT_483249 [Calycina marina]|uniref:F-box domain-containing protein n=1 Tax=Calycina marina TaxID=1763456 RepID=A0A9P7YW68_9HELO|nr:hypothetical protein BJ878DRAFT_483249 [Calycina marina]
MGIDVEFPRPMAFDRVMEGTAIAAHNSPLFTIPTEILNNIISQLSDVASLALVNSDCRQLARSCQFRTVTFDFSPRSEKILTILQRETVERGQTRGHTRSLSLGACIRRVVVNNDGYWKKITAARPRKSGIFVEDTSENAYDDDENKVQQWRTFAEQLTHKMNEIYRPTVLFVLSGLVHLESLDMHQVDWSQSLLNNLTACSIRRLSLVDVKLANTTPVMEDSVVWPLERLDIKMGWDFEFSQEPNGPRLNASTNWYTILRLCSASLNVLFLSHHPAVTIMGNREDVVSFSLNFPQLRQLDLSWENHLDQSALRSLILTSPHLSTLAINYGHRATKELLDREAYIESLETLVLYLNNSIPDDSSLAFLKNNPQLKAFAIYDAGASVLLERAISLLTAFSDLRMLSMTWEGRCIPDSSLGALSSLISLETLHLSSGFQIGWRHDWSIHHNNIITSIKTLRKLRQVAFTRDMYSYTREGELFDYTSYSQLRDEAWDLHHRCMRVQALKYAEAFPDLEFIHMGHISFKVERVRNGFEVVATDDEGYSWMSNCFGISR